jgi:ABC-type sugar transport system substrate-binding protein
MKRRLFLSGIGGAALATPYLSSIERSAKAAEGDPRRLVIFYTNNGCLTNRWFPSVEDGVIDSASLAGTTLTPIRGR